MALVCHGGFNHGIDVSWRFFKYLGKQRIMENGLDLGGVGCLVGACPCTGSCLLWLIDALGFVVSRPGRLRTGLRVYFAMPFSCNHMSCMGGTWPTNLQSFIAVDPAGVWVVFYGLSFMIM